MSLVRALMVGCILLSGCASQGLRVGDGVTEVKNHALPEPGRPESSSAGHPFYVGPFDELIIDVVGIGEFSKKELQVDGSGRLSFPLVGTIDATGKTPSEIAAIIASGLKEKHVRNPQVTVNLTKMVSQVVTVGGEVKEPGLYPVFGQMSLLKAVASAKGTTEFSSLSDVVIFRTVDGKSYAGLYSIKAIRAGTYPDPEIFANDVVMVGDSRGRRIFKDFIQLLPLLTTPIIVALQN